MKFDWSTHDNLHFELDGNIPLGGCHHQKLVIIDDQLAYCGGIDITRGRWDTREHKVEDSRRLLPDNTMPQPHHDIQMAVAGEIAGDVGELGRQRWSNACSRPIKSKVDSKQKIDRLWPRSLKVDVRNVSVAVSRTVPNENLDGEYEIEQLYLDVIENAEDYIYFENQYFSSETIVDALKKCLQKEKGPEIILVTPLRTDGWLSQQTMDQQRAKLVEMLQQHDRFDRLLVLYPRISKNDDTELNVHSKLTIADNQFIRIGSANLSNRSMRLDSECDLSIFEKHRSDVKTAIQSFRNKLLAEHLALPFRKVSRYLNANSSLKHGIEQLCEYNQKRDKTRTLLPLPLDRYQETIPLSEFSDLFDPTEPIEAKSLLNYLAKTNRPPDEQPASGSGWSWSWIAIGCFCCIMMALWKWGPLQEWADLNRVQESLQWLKDTPLASCIAIVGLTVTTLSVPSRWPMLALDRVMIDPQYQNSEVAVVNTALARAASDHLPLLVDVFYQ